MHVILKAFTVRSARASIASSRGELRTREVAACSSAELGRSVGRSASLAVVTTSYMPKVHDHLLKQRSIDIYGMARRAAAVPLHELEYLYKLPFRLSS